MHTYICIDLKSFYASVECVLRGLDPLKTNLVVADTSRTEKTICLAVSPSLKEYKISSRARLFEVIQRVEEINNERKKENKYKPFRGKSYLKDELVDKSLELTYIAATPQMQKYIDYSSKVYNIYLKYIAPEDIHVYSIDEAFMDVTSYLKAYKMDAVSLCRTIIREIYLTTGITATGGIGTNLYLAKVAMDIEAKKKEPDEYGCRVCFLDEELYKKSLWNHMPITDFWRIGNGYKNRLEPYGIYTMGDVARAAIEREDLLYDLFGVNAEILIDHAFGIEPVTIKDIKAYRPQNTSLSQGQVIHCAYDYKKALIVIKEMAYELCLDMVKKGILTDQVGLSIGYDIESKVYDDVEYGYDLYGRKIPRGIHSSINLNEFTNSSLIITKALTILYDRLVDKRLLVRRVNVVATHTIKESDYNNAKKYTQFSIFTDFDNYFEEEKKRNETLKKEKALQETVLKLKSKFGKNSVIKGIDLEDGATTLDRNKQIGGHKA